MKEYNKALYSRYVIDGVQLEATPYELLIECSNRSDKGDADYRGEENILDEQLDPPLSSHTFSDEEFSAYLALTSGTDPAERKFPICFPEFYTRLRAAEALIGSLWKKGHYKSGNVLPELEWTWNEEHIGNMAAFYQSVYAANEYIFDLGLRINGFSYTPGSQDCRLKVTATVPTVSIHEDPETEMEELDFKESPYKSRHAVYSEERACPERFVEDPESWIIYIPFDTCAPKLGASLLAEACHHGGEAAPAIQDPDYTVDCYEVVRELVEDGIIISGTTVADGGLACAIKRMCGNNGMEIGLGGLKASCPGATNTQILFAEIPGVLVQIRDIDYDYIDAQLLLQDVAYYPLGHPDMECGEIRIAESNDSDVSGILKSLMDQASEGED